MKKVGALAQTIVYMASMVGILVFVNWTPSPGASVLWDAVLYRQVLDYCSFCRCPDLQPGPMVQPG